MKGKFREPLKILSALLEEKSALSLIRLQVELKPGNPHIRALTQGCFRRHVTAPAAYTHILQAEVSILNSQETCQDTSSLPKHGSASGGFPAQFSCGGSWWWIRSPCGYHPHKQPFSQKDAHTTMMPCRPWMGLSPGEAAFQPTLPLGLWSGASVLGEPRALSQLCAVQSGSCQPGSNFSELRRALCVKYTRDSSEM